MGKIKKPKNKPQKKSEEATTTESNAEEMHVPSVVSGQLKKKLKKQQEKNKEKQRGVVFLKSLPHGFFEDQMKQYFEQFGTVTRVRLARSKKTGGSKGYAFVEFEMPEVAQVASETMNNYLMFKRVVKASYIPPEQQHFNYFRSSVRKVTNKVGKTIFVSGKTAAVQRQVKSVNDWSEENYQKRTEAKLKKIQKLNKKYAHLGINFDEILVGPKSVAGNKPEESDDGKENLPKAAGNAKSAKKSLKRKAEAEAEKPSGSNKKLNSSIQLEDLLGNTIADDSEDEDFEPSDNDGEGTGDGGKTVDSSIQLEDLLGDTIVEDSEDGDFALSDDDEEASGSSSDENSYNIEFPQSESDSEDDSEGGEEEEEDPVNIKSNKKGNLAKNKSKAVKKETKSKVNKKEQKESNLLQRKPNGGVVKPKNNKKFGKTENSSNKAKISKQLELAKEVAKPLSVLKQPNKKKNKAKGKK